MYNDLDMCKLMTGLKLLLLRSITWNNLIVCKQMSSNSF